MSNPVIYGLHHITLCASGAQEDVDSITQVLGLRLIKQTVLVDGRYARYHPGCASRLDIVGECARFFTTSPPRASSSASVRSIVSPRKSGASVLAARSSWRRRHGGVTPMKPPEVWALWPPAFMSTT